MGRYSLNELRNMPTISQGQADNLKVDNSYYRVWLSRCTVADGEPYDNKVTVEELIDGYWRETEIYQAR